MSISLMDLTVPAEIAVRDLLALHCITTWTKWESPTFEACSCRSETEVTYLRYFMPC